MRTTNIRTVHISENELRDILCSHISKNGQAKLSEHIKKSACIMEWSKSSQEFVISFDGELLDD